MSAGGEQSSGRGARWQIAAAPGLALLLLLVGACSRPPCCRVDGDCADGYACVAGSCRVRCQFSGQCPTGQHCAADPGVCVGGPYRSDCPAPLADGSVRDASSPDTAGDGGSVEAGSPDRALADRDGRDALGTDLPARDVPTGQDLASVDQGSLDQEITDKPPDDLSGQELVEACVDDIFEENDSRQQATPLAGPPVDAVLCPGDSDFYSVTRGPNTAVRVVLGCSDAPVAVRVILRLPGDARVARSCDPAVGRVEASLAAPEPGPAVVEVFAAEPVRAVYRLEVHVEGETPPCGTDAFEPNNSASAAAPLRFGVAINAAACDSDVDYFAVAMASGTNLGVTQTAASVCAGDSLTLLSSDGSTVLATDSSSTAQRAVSHHVEVAGNYYLQVTSGCAVSSFYQLRIGDSACAEDGFEDNDSLETAATVIPGFLAAAICRDDDDYYGLELPEGAQLRLDLRFSHVAGDLDLALFDPRNRRVGLSQGVSDVEVIQHSVERSGRHTARVYGFNNAEGPYTLDLCVDDPFEPNDSIAAARPIAVGQHALRLCRGDLDVFRMFLPGAVMLRVWLTTPADVVGLTLTLYAVDSGAVLASGTPGDAAVLLSYFAENGRDVAIEVSGPAQTLPYQLRLETSTD